MKAGVLAGNLRADRQVLKVAELDVLFQVRGGLRDIYGVGRGRNASPRGVPSGCAWRGVAHSISGSTSMFCCARVAYAGARECVHTYACTHKHTTQLSSHTSLSPSLSPSPSPNPHTSGAQA